MNREQIVGLLRHLLPFIGGMAIGAGWVSEESWGVISEEMLKMAGPVLTLLGLVWSYFDKTDKAIVSKAIAVPEVEKIECSHTKEGAALAASVPHKDVVMEAERQPYITERVAQAYPRKK